ncbi:MAG: AMP-binding protein [Desulfosarcina sp.]|nr:AMP-binding protein [Desulfobacterales bacterium]
MNVAEWVSKRAQLYPDRLFLKQDDRACSNRRFDERVNRIARALMACGLQRGARVVTLMSDASAFLGVFFACARAGAIIVPLNANLALPELDHIIRDCAPRLLVYTRDAREAAAALKTAGRGIAHCWSCEEDLPPADLAAGTIDRGLPVADGAPDEAVCLDDPLLIMYTSGTTGTAKGAVLTHGNFLFGAIHSLLNYRLDATCKSLVVAPLFHIGALAASVMPVVYAGGQLVLKSFDNPSDVLTCIGREKITYMFAVPVMYEMMAKSPRWPAADFAHTHFFISGGAPMPVPLIRKYQREKGIRFAQGYGMTETLRITALDLEDAVRKAGSIGKEVFHTLLRIVDDNGRDLGANATGEIIVKGPTVFLKYWNQPQATEAVLRDGWFYTGDLGRRDEDGFVYIVGRKSDLIICAGENIYAAEVERAIADHPQVAEAAAVGLPDARRGEIVVAFVRRAEACELEEGALHRYLDGKIAAFKHPRKIHFVKDFPRNQTGKILKAELKKAFEVQRDVRTSP